MNIEILSFDDIHLLGESTTGRSRGFGSYAIRLRSSTGLQASTRPARTIARFCDSLAALLLLVECSPPRRRALPGSRKSAHSHLSNYRFQVQ